MRGEMEDLIEAVKSAANEVFTELGAGHREGVYEEALSHEFRLRGYTYERQRNCEVIYKKHTVGTTRIDLILGSKLIVETKAVKRLTESHRNQIRAYYETSGLSKGIILNFPPESDEVVLENVLCASARKRKEERPVSTAGSAKDILGQVRAAADEVCSILGTEFAYQGSDIYGNALNVEFRLRKIPYIYQTSELLYKNHIVDTFNNFLVDGKYLVNLEFEEHISEEAEEEMKFGLQLSKLKQGLIINFPPGAVSVEIKEIRII